MKDYFKALKRLNEAVLLEYNRADLKTFAGPEYAEKFFTLRPKLQAPENDLGYWIKKGNVEEFKTFIDDWESGKTKSKTQQKKDDIVKGAELIYSDPNWKVYHVTDYSAAKILGSNTTWCITGRYRRYENRGQHFFDQYIKDYKLDGYYFIFDLNHKDHNDVAKYCAGVTKDGKLAFLYNGMQDHEISRRGIPNIPEDQQIQPIPGIKIPYYNVWLVEDGVLVFADRDELDKESNYENGITIPSNVKVIGSGVFSGWKCSKYILPSSVIEIKSFAFRDSMVQEINLENVEEVGAGAFMGSTITSAKLPNVVSIKRYAFAFCNNLKQVAIGGNCQDIRSDAFEETDCDIYSTNPVAIELCKERGLDCLNPETGEVLTTEGEL